MYLAIETRDRSISLIKIRESEYLHDYSKTKWCGSCGNLEYFDMLQLTIKLFFLINSIYIYLQEKVDLLISDQCH